MSQNELFHDACVIIEQAQRLAFQAVNEILIKRNWLLGMRIQHEVLKDQRAEYGEQVIITLAKELTAKYKTGFTKTNLYNYVSFFEAWPNFFHAMSGKTGKEVTDNIFHAVSGKSLENTDILNSLRSKSPIRLSWTHYRIILQETTADGRAWYENEAAQEMWSTRTLQRNVSSQYYHRLLQSQDKTVVHNEMVELTKPLQDKLEYLKSPVIAEFLGFKNNTDYSESNLEQSIIDHLISFLMELGKGFAFVDRQKHIHTDKEDYYIDLVFYNYHLRCFVLIDLKTTKLNYQDVGQMDMYVKMYDELVRPDGHNPTIGMLLCAETDEDVAHYSVLNSNDQLYAAKYLTYMPTQDELRREIEQQKSSTDYNATAQLTDKFFYVSLKQINIFPNNIQMIEPVESLLALLDKSHIEVMTGQTLSMEEVDSFMKNKSLQLKNHVNRKDCMTVDDYISLIKEELDQHYN